MVVNVAPCWAVRTAGLPLEVVDGRAYDRCIELLGELDHHLVEVHRAGDELADLLHHAVNRLAGKSDLTGPVLRLRRDAHSGRVPSRSVEKFLFRIREVLTHQERESLDCWMAHLDNLAAARRSYELSVEAAVETTHRARVEALKRPEILRGIAIASPTLCLALLDGDTPHTRPAKRRRLERSVALYMGRISRKTSPFSTLTTVITQSADGTAQALPDSIIEVAPALRQTLLDTLAMYEACPDVVLRGPTISMSSPNAQACARVLLPIRSCYDNFFYAEDTAFDVPRELDVLVSEEIPHTVGEWLHILDRDRWSLAELIAEGLLVPQPPLGGLKEIVTEPAGCEHTSGAALRSILDAESSVADPRPDVRAVGLLQLRERAAEFVAAREGVAPSWMRTAPLVHETCVTDPELVPLIPQGSLRQAMTDVAKIIQPTVARSTFYDAVIEAFQALSGSAGRLPLVEFVTSCVSSPLMTSITNQTMWRDFQRAEWSRAHGVDEAIRCDGLGTLAPATFTAFLQPIGDRSDSWSMAVLNRVNQGPGGLLVRWGELQGCAHHLTTHYTPWLQTLHPDARIAALTTGDSWAGVQKIPDYVVPRLLWPTHALSSGRHEADISATDLDVVLDSETATLQVVLRATGQPVALPYLGVIPQHLLRGAGKILHALTDPWVYDFRLGLEAMDTRLEPQQPIEMVPREMAGAVVVRRCSWRVHTHTMPLVGGRATPDAATLLAEYHRWRSHHRIPRRVYVKTGEQVAGNLRRNKPLFVDLADPSGLDLLLKLAHEVTWVSIEEALPDDDAWWPIGSHAPRCMEITATMALGSGNRR